MSLIIMGICYVVYLKDQIVQFTLQSPINFIGPLLAQYLKRPTFGPINRKTIRAVVSSTSASREEENDTAIQIPNSQTLILGSESENSIDEIGVFSAEIRRLRCRISERELGSVRKIETVNAEAKTAVASLLPLASPSQQPYVSELLSFTIDRLHKDSELLRVDAERIQRQMQEVAVANYRAFISAADALLSIREEVSSIDKHLEPLVRVRFGIL